MLLWSLQEWDFLGELAGSAEQLGPFASSEALS